MSDNTERAEFEAWARDRWTGVNLARCEDGYIAEVRHGVIRQYASLQMLWESWRDARATRAAQAVPAEPTAAMLDRGAMEFAMTAQRVQTAERSARDIYRAMLAAAPTPPAAAEARDAELMPLLDAYVAAHCDWFATGHESARAYAALARSNLLDALAAHQKGGGECDA